MYHNIEASQQARLIVGLARHA